MRLAYSVSEVAAMLGVSRAWIYQQWAEGNGPARRKIGSRTLITAVALDDWLNSRAVGQDTNGGSP